MVWLTDTPLEYTPAFGPKVEVRLAFHSRNTANLVDAYEWHGAEFGNSEGGLRSLVLLALLLRRFKFGRIHGRPDAPRGRVGHIHLSHELLPKQYELSAQPLA